MSEFTRTSYHGQPVTVTHFGSGSEPVGPVVETPVIETSNKNSYSALKDIGWAIGYIAADIAGKLPKFGFNWTVRRNS